MFLSIHPTPNSSVSFWILINEVVIVCLAFFQLTFFFCHASRLLFVGSSFHLSSLPSAPVCEYTMIYLPRLLFTDIRVVSDLELLWKTLLRTFLYTPLGKHTHAVLQGIHWGVELLAYWLSSDLLGNAKLFSEVVVPVHTFTAFLSGLCGFLFWFLLSLWIFINLMSFSPCPCSQQHSNRPVFGQWEPLEVWLWPHGLWKCACFLEWCSRLLRAAISHFSKELWILLYTLF